MLPKTCRPSLPTLHPTPGVLKVLQVLEGPRKSGLYRVLSPFPKSRKQVCWNGIKRISAKNQAKFTTKRKFTFFFLELPKFSCLRQCLSSPACLPRRWGQAAIFWCHNLCNNRSGANPGLYSTQGCKICKFSEIFPTLRQQFHVCGLFKYWHQNSALFVVIQPIFYFKFN